MKMEHYVTAYDSESESLLALVFDVPSVFMGRVREIAHVAPNDIDAVGSYPLSDEEAREIASLLKRPLDINNKTVFFLEPVSSE
jgi:hypothetical protein